MNPEIHHLTLKNQSHIFCPSQGGEVISSGMQDSTLFRVTCIKIMPWLGSGADKSDFELALARFRKIFGLATL